MKTLYRIENQLFNNPWCIMPSVHTSLVNQFKAHLTGKVQLPFDTDDDDDEEDDSMATLSTNPSTAVVCVDGVIGKHLSLLETQCGGVDLDTVVEELNEAVANPDVKNILLYFATPGGTSLGTPEAGQAIADAAKIKPVFGYTNTLCGSAGYWLASQCTAFFCSPSSVVGSIGVYNLLLDESKALENAGLNIVPVYKGDFKLAGASFRPLSDEEKAMFQADVNRIYANFVQAVNSNRTIKAEFCQGQTFNGEQAVINGLADGLANDLGEVLELINS